MWADGTRRACPLEWDWDAPSYCLGMWETQELGVGSPDHLDTSIPPHPNMTAIHTPSVGGPGLSPTVVRFSVPWTRRFSPPPPYGR